MTTPRHIFIGSAWPYANGPLHLGHVASLLPADVLARYYRQRGDNVFFDSGSDCHGTPISVLADAQKTTPAAIAEKYHAIIADTFSKLGFTYDLYNKTTDPRHAELVQEIFLKLKDGGYLVEREQELTYCETDKRFLPDRYVEGTCPICGFSPARGDQCDNCKSLLDPTELKDAHCKICGNPPTRRPSKHFFLQLPKLQKQLEEWVSGQSTQTWRPNAQAFVKQFLKEGLQERAVTRDIDWGVPVPVAGYEDKRIYVWFEAVCGYLTAHRIWGEKNGQPNAWKTFWNSTTARHYYVHGKDNIPFHTIIWPAILLAHGELHLPETIVSSEYLTVEGKKLSTSRNWAVWVDDVLERYQPDALRYFLLANGPESRDADFSWDVFVAKTNNELVAAYGNLVQRVTSLIQREWQGTVPSATEIVPDDSAAIATVTALYEPVGTLIEAGNFKEALAQIFSTVQKTNAWIDQRAPWKTLKSDEAAAKSTLAAAAQIIANLAQLTAPFLPFQAQQLAQAFDLKLAWEPAAHPTTIKPLASLFQKIDPTVVPAEKAKLGESR